MEKNRFRVSVTQWDLLLDFLENHPKLISGYNNSIQGRTSSHLLWNNIAEILNAEKHGAIKEGRDWATYVSNYKCKLKRQLIDQNKAPNSETHPKCQLTDIDIRLMSILGPTFGHGLSQVKVELVHNEISSSQSNNTCFSISNSVSQDSTIENIIEEQIDKTTEEPIDNIIEEQIDNIVEGPVTNSESCTDPLVKTEDELLEVTESPFKNQTPLAKPQILTQTSSSQSTNTRFSISDSDSQDRIEEPATSSESCTDPLLDSEDELLEETEIPIKNQTQKKETNRWNLSIQSTGKLQVEPITPVEEEIPKKVANCWVAGIKTSDRIISPTITQVKKQIPTKRTNSVATQSSDDLLEEESIDEPVIPVKKASLPAPIQKFASRTDDEFGLFGQTVAQKLRQLPLTLALETEEMILATLRKQRVKVMTDS